jgi:hypothetical protein
MQWYISVTMSSGTIMLLRVMLGEGSLSRKPAVVAAGMGRKVFITGIIAQYWGAGI